MLIDTHAHINFKDYKEDGDEVVKRALENDIWLINVGAEADTSRRAVEYSQRYPEGVFAAVGLHPIHIQDQEFSYEKYKELAQNDKVVAIGEVGLDYYRIENNVFARGKSPKGLLEIKEKQKALFKKQTELAIDLELPVIIHCRNAHKEVIEILTSYFLNLKSGSRGVIHSFSGNYKQARQYWELGFKIAFNGIITFSRDYDKVILDAPIEDILLETDCPYLTPVPYRGQRNEPLYIIEVAKKLAAIKDLSLEKVMIQTTDNAKRVFQI